MADSTVPVFGDAKGTPCCFTGNIGHEGDCRNTIPLVGAIQARDIAQRWAGGETHSVLQADYNLSHAAVYTAAKAGVKQMIDEIETLRAALLRHCEGCRCE